MNMAINQDKTLLDEHFFNSINLDFALRIMSLEETTKKVLDPDNDSFTVEYHGEAEAYCLIHNSYIFGESKPIAYIGDDKKKTSDLVPFLFFAFKEAYAEYLI